MLIMTSRNDTANSLPVENWPLHAALGILWFARIVHVVIMYVAVAKQTRKGGGSRRRRSSNLESPKSQRNAPSRRRSVACDGKGDGDLTSSAEAPGLTEPKFFDWLSQVAVECKALTTKNTFGHSLRRSPSKRGNPGRNLRGKAESGHSIQGGSSAMESGVNGAASARRNAARAVVLLQWMEVSRGMKSKKTGDIPPFRLSSCLVNGKRLS